MRAKVRECKLCGEPTRTLDQVCMECKDDHDYAIKLSLKSRPWLYEALKRAARREFRTIPEQILYYVSDRLNNDPEMHQFIKTRMSKSAEKRQEQNKLRSIEPQLKRSASS